MTPKIARFLVEQQPATPCLVLDVDRVEDNFRALRRTLGTFGDDAAAGTVHGLRLRKTRNNSEWTFLDPNEPKNRRSRG